MIDIALEAVVGLMLAAQLFISIACYSLRDFSWSRLEEICKRHGREARFSTIIKRYEEVLLGAELLQVVAFVALIGGFSFWLLQPPIPAGEAVTLAELHFTGWLALSVPALIVACVMLPWTAARIGGELVLFRAWPLLNGLRALTSPVIWLLRRFDQLVHRMLGLEEPEADEAATITEEIRTAVDEGQREGILESSARTMIHRVMELQDVDVADIMTPRTAMVCIAVDADLETARQLFLDEGHSRIPVIGKTTDDVVGMLYAKDLLRFIDAKPAGEPPALSEIAREPFYVPETMGIDTLLKSFKRQRVHLAIVLDEYGGVAGLVTMEDILEEIVGEIVDEYDSAATEQIHTVSPGVSEIDARAHIDDVNEQLALNLPADRDFDTIGGFVFSLLGRIPVEGEQFTWEQLRFTVLQADKRKVVRVRVEVDQSVPAAPGEVSQ